MKCCPLTLAIMAATLGTSDGQTLVETGGSVAPGAAGVRFTGSALVPATALGIGGRFASVSNLSVTQVPEPSTLALGFLGAAVGFRRRR